MNSRCKTRACHMSNDIAEVVSTEVVLQTTHEGRIQAVRARKDKDKNPDRMSLDRRGLTQLPVIVGEPRLRLLSLQHNLLSRLDGLGVLGLSRLVFLDLYDNQLERMSGMDTLENLRVLLVGKNRIRRIEGLGLLVKLEVLDLHGNQIYQVGGLKNLGELKVLNMAGNQIRAVGNTDLQGLRSLQELNLRRNRIKRLSGFADTPQLQKLFVSNNELLTVENMSSITEATQLREVTVDGNPVAVGGDCMSFLVSHLPRLRLLSRMEVTAAVREAAMAWRSNRAVDMRREEVISNARTNWELLRSQTRSSSSTSLSSSLRDLRAEIDLTGPKVPERQIQSDSGVSGMTSSGYTLPPARGVVSISAEVRRLKFSRRTVSQDSDTSQNTASSSSVDYFKLPPILATTFSNAETQPVVNAMHRCESSSSIEPNVDSSLSSLPSDSSSGGSEAEDPASSEEPPKATGEAAAEESMRNVKSATPYRKHSCRRVQARPATSRPQHKSSGKVREQGGDFLVEILGRVLNVYGQGSLRFIDRPWSAGKASDVTTVRFHYVNFNSMIHVLGRIKQRFTGAEHFVFRETNISYLGQLNALADIQGLSSLQIEPEGNPVVYKEWQSYAIYRLGHWGLHILNEKEVAEEAMSAASEEFQALSDIVLWSLPDSLLQPLLARLRLDDSRPGERPTSAKQWLWGADPALRSVVSKEAMQWRKGGLSQEDVMWRRRGRIYFGRLLEVVCAAVEKLRLLEEQWHAILLELVTETLVDYSHLDSYMKKCMAALK